MSFQPNLTLAPGPPIVYEGHTDTVLSVAFSPNGNSVASSSNDKIIRIWDTHNTSSMGMPLEGHTNWVLSISYSPLGDIIASGSKDKTIRLWDLGTAQQIGEPLQGDHAFRSVAFSPNAQFIAAGCGVNRSRRGLDMKCIQLWELGRKMVVSRTFQGHEQGVTSVGFHPCRDKLISGSFDRAIRIWDIEHGVTIVGPLEEHTDSIFSVAISPDGAQMVSCSGDSTIRFWDPRSGKSISNPYKGHGGSVLSVAFDPTGRYVVSGGEDTTVRLWDVRNGRQVDHAFQEHTDIVNSVTFSPCGQYISSGSDDWKVIVRNTMGGVPELPSNPESYRTSGEESNPIQNEIMQTVSREMSMQQMFDCLIGHGCIDVSSNMSTVQEAAMVVSGGGFGDIWMCHTYDGMKVAVKAWQKKSVERCSPKTMKRAARELYYWSRMKHKNIHHLMGVIIFKNLYLGMVSEWMENGNLHEYILSHPTANRYQLCLDVASGLEYMHSQNTVHGDLKAANVLVSADGTARISDFDFSVLLEAGSLTFTASSNTRSGSVRWVAPEILRGNGVKRTKQSDVYALGMTILEIFTRNVPYPDIKFDFTVMRIVDEGTLPPCPVEWLNDQEGNGIWRTLLDCWSRDLNTRPSAEKVLEAIRSSGLCEDSLPQDDSPTMVTEMPQEEASSVISSEMSIQQMFDCLRDTGCVDLSSQMNTGQDTAMIVSGGGFGDIWKGCMNDGTKVAIKAWRSNSLGQCAYKTIKCTDVATGLEYMHDQSTVHGDIKAANVLVSSDGIAMISDFDFSVMSKAGSLVFTESSNTRTGSLRWTAPELLLAEIPTRTEQSDVYALGMTMLEIFTGDVPYPDFRTDFSVIKLVERGTLPTRPIQLKGDMRGETTWHILLQCWSRNIGERLSARQVVETLWRLESSDEAQEQ
ncbi:WD repeat-containing protein 5 homolog [Dictyostelium discoideum] [Rhizoctonia solani]|uniref:WD repeat-containing protein 5 homolog [Dictyostelium discoideum] n=1 Tax=Rhizoctonia solani TaxID=456999 RepID=A0A0K6FNY2_9AGAM|nr:WD repeat-containing protein 5 homolog [Dictyostelium discoideum] [Rhizoctonia solani]